MITIKKNGFVLIYVLVILIPVMLLGAALLDYVFMDYKTNINLAYKQQTYYNSETGLIDAIKRYSKLKYNSLNYSTYYLNFSSLQILFQLTPPINDNYVMITVSFHIDSIKTYNIDSTGYYKGCKYKINKQFSE